MRNTGDIEKSNKIERNSDKNEVSDNLRSEAVSGKMDNGKAFAAMDAGKSNPQAEKMLQSTQLTIVDHDALNKAVDDNGYIDASVQNSVRAQVGHEAAESAFANAKFTHATALTERQPYDPSLTEVRASAQEVRTGAKGA